eukprot:765830-Hanusia_phi.AAC.2
MRQGGVGGKARGLKEGAREQLPRRHRFEAERLHLLQHPTPRILDVNRGTKRDTPRYSVDSKTPGASGARDLSATMANRPPMNGIHGGEISV